MCNCKTKDLSQNIGTEQSLYVRLPVFMRGQHKNTFIWIDKCLAKEIKTLWSEGIITTGCCCGHNFKCPYIGVDSESSERMKQLGYKVQYNPFDPNHDNEFYPKSVKVRLKFRINNYFMKLFRIKK